jgi:predicted metal-dependent phosphoesterase TrpH
MTGVSPESRNSLRADLHVHSYHSGYSTSLPLFRSRDSYSDPEAIYRSAKARGMDLVTITDHDSIDGCLEFLDRHPDAKDFIVGEEIECQLPDGDLTIHVGALSIDERIHREIQPLRDNVYDVAAFLREAGVPFCLNHPFMFYRERVDLSSYVTPLLRHFPGMEARNGAMLPTQNRLVERILDDAQRWGNPLARIGGSDAHVLTRVGTTYTEAPGATREEFLESLRIGRSRVGGRHGSTFVLAREIYSVIFTYWASLLGLARADLTGPDRLRDIGLSVISIPLQFVPFLVAAAQKNAESRRIARLGRRWLAYTEAHLSIDSQLVLDDTPP